jgi:hypothetical protein
LHTIAAHLSPRGRFIFDTRNPAARAWLAWTPQQPTRVIGHPRYGTVTAWHDATFDAESETVRYETHYHIAATGETLSAKSHIRFIGKDRLGQLIAQAGLRVDRWLGNWAGSDYHQASREIIPVGRLAV